MKDLIVLAGAPASGKSTVAALLKRTLGSPYVDLGWLRHFHLERDWTNANEDEERMSFENLVYIVRNYIRHGYRNVIISDLHMSKVQEVPELFKDCNYIIATLIINDVRELQKRVLGRKNAGCWDVERSLQGNRNWKSQPALRNEYKIDNTDNRPDQTLTEILKLLRCAGIRS